MVRVNIEFSCSPDLTPKAAASQRSLDMVIVISESVVIINSHLLFHCPPSHISYILDWYDRYRMLSLMHMKWAHQGCETRRLCCEVSKVSRAKTLEIRRLPRKSYADTLEPSSQGALTTVSGWAGWERVSVSGHQCHAGTGESQSVGGREPQRQHLRRKLPTWRHSPCDNPSEISEGKVTRCRKELREWEATRNCF